MNKWKIPYHLVMIRDCYKDTLRKILGKTDLKGKRIVEVGCGAGRITQTYMDAPSLIVGVEPEFEAVCQGTKNVPNAIFICGSGMNLPFPPGCFDVILFSLSLHHHPDSLAALTEAGRVLAHTGLILILEPTIESEIQRFCKPFEDEDHKLIAVEDTLARNPFDTISKEVFTTHWEFNDFADAANYAFTYFNHPPDEDKRKALQDFLGPKAQNAPIRMTDTLCLTSLRLPR